NGSLAELVAKVRAMVPRDTGVLNPGHVGDTGAGTVAPSLGHVGDTDAAQDLALRTRIGIPAAAGAGDVSALIDIYGELVYWTMTGRFGHRSFRELISDFMSLR
ncbi:MAG: hypothetical protein KAT30_02385, partial [Candidatus Krumholzibacteria bacterium]|nr:hypothetical protein [Candidatus Krumholzibacteria bacterium]